MKGEMMICRTSSDVEKALVNLSGRLMNLLSLARVATLCANLICLSHSGSL